MLYLQLVRSPYAHARMTRVDVSKAAAAPGVVCTLTGAELPSISHPFPEIGPGAGQKVEDYALAINKVRYQGEPVAAVVAESRHAAEDAAELVEVDYDPLPVVMTPEDALQSDSLLHDEAGPNRMWHDVFEFGAVDKAFLEALHIVHIRRLHSHPPSPTPPHTPAPPPPRTIPHTPHHHLTPP